MEILTKNFGTNGLLVKPVGKIDINTAVEFGTTVNDALDDIKELIIDLEKVDYISSIGLRVFLELQQTMNGKGEMKVKNVVPAVYNVFVMTGFNKILNIQ